MNQRDNIKAFFSDRVEQYSGSLYITAYRLTGSKTDAEDLVADSIVRAWASIDSLEDRQRFRPWLFRIMHNCFISSYRKKSVRPTESSYDANPDEQADDEIASLLIKQPDDFLLWWGNPEREVINSILGNEIMAAIERLPEVFRITVLLINVEGFSYDEAAEILEVATGTIRSRMKRGRTLLQKALWQHAKDEGLITGDTISRCGT